jgi:transcriptional antiterminator RfaH
VLCGKVEGKAVADWYLLRTKTGAERIAQEQLRTVVERTLLPLAKTQIRQRERSFERVAPLFPCYLFAFFPLAETARRIRYTPGVRDVVRFGERAATVPRWVIEQLTLRCEQGPVDLTRPPLLHGAAVRVVDGPFRHLDAVFDEYLTGVERVAVLLSVMNAERRVVMPTEMVMAAG